MLKSFQEHFCEKERCTAEQFARKVFFRTLYPQAKAFVTLLGGFRSDYFAADRELISGAGRATTMNQLRVEAEEFAIDSNNRGWLRQRVKIRVSTTRLKQLARQYLTEGEGQAPDSEEN